MCRLWRRRRTWPHLLIKRAMWFIHLITSKGQVYDTHAPSTHFTFVLVPNCFSYRPFLTLPAFQPNMELFTCLGWGMPSLVSVHCIHIRTILNRTWNSIIVTLEYSHSFTFIIHHYCETLGITLLAHTKNKRITTFPTRQTFVLPDINIHTVHYCVLYQFG